MHVHDGGVRTPACFHILIGVQPHQQEVTSSLGQLFEEGGVGVLRGGEYGKNSRE